MQLLLPAGTRYEAYVPQTLDLAERARIALNGLGGVLDPHDIHEMYFMVGFGCHPPFMYKDTTGWPTNNPKFAESFPMMRVMSGSPTHLDREEAMMQSMMNAIGDDGLFYAVASANRPWHEGIHHKYPPTGEDFANTYGNARMLLALMAWYARSPSDALWQAMVHMGRGLAAMAVDKGDYAYYPDGKIGEAFSRPRSGWRDTAEPEVEAMGAEGSMFMYHGGQIRALARWYEMSGDRYCLDIATKLVRFVMKPRFWGLPGEHPSLLGAQHAHFTGHFHGHLSLLRGLLEYARVIRDVRLIDFVREGYEFCRHYGIPQMGWFANRQGGRSEGCTIADMVALAARLCDVGAGDYWEDVEQITRNHLAEQQLIDEEKLVAASLAGPARPAGTTVPFGQFTPDPAKLPGQLADHDVFARARGVYAGVSAPDAVPDVWTMQCCTGNGTQALYYAWESILRSQGNDTIQINLLLNRASPWLDVESSLPYEGKVVLKNKSARRLAVRIPRWVADDELTCLRNGNKIDSVRVGNYLLCPDVSPQDEIALEFPIHDRTTVYTVDDTDYECHFRGNDLISIRPQLAGSAYPMYTDRAGAAGATPMTTVERYVTPNLLPW